jgi:hypothetical protein
MQKTYRNIVNNKIQKIKYKKMQLSLKKGQFLKSGQSRNTAISPQYLYSCGISHIYYNKI